MAQATKGLPVKPILLALSGMLAIASCGEIDPVDGEEQSCGPANAHVIEAIDGDTIRLADGNIVRYLLVDTPELFGSKEECHAEASFRYNQALVEGQDIELSYDKVCRDDYGRLLAYVTRQDFSINELLLERGHACILHIPPNGKDKIDRYRQIEQAAQEKLAGLWGACAPPPC